MPPVRNAQKQRNGALFVQVRDDAVHAVAGVARGHARDRSRLQAQSACPEPAGLLDTRSLEGTQTEMIRAI